MRQKSIDFGIVKLHFDPKISFHFKNGSCFLEEQTSLYLYASLSRIYDMQRF